MNIFTFDIEEWFIEKHYKGGRNERYEKYGTFLDFILHTLESSNTYATFFCVGKMAEEFPDVIKKISSCGHEIGCHSNVPQWLNKMTYNQVLQDTRQAVDSIEQLIGSKVKSYRAPAFSIGKTNQWTFEILAECGIERDASVFPATRDFGGFPDFGTATPAIVSYNGISIKEFPIPLLHILGKDFAYSGGGYFRFFPLSIIQKQIKRNKYVMTYFHIGDLLQTSDGIMSKSDYEQYFREVGTLAKRIKRYIRGNWGKRQAAQKLESLIKKNDFINLDVADQTIDWNTVKRINL